MGAGWASACFLVGGGGLSPGACRLAGVIGCWAVDLLFVHHQEMADYYGDFTNAEQRGKPMLAVQTAEEFHAKAADWLRRDVKKFAKTHRNKNIVCAHDT